MVKRLGIPAFIAVCLLVTGAGSEPYDGGTYRSKGGVYLGSNKFVESNNHILSSARMDTTWSEITTSSASVLHDYEASPFDTSWAQFVVAGSDTTVASGLFRDTTSDTGFVWRDEQVFSAYVRNHATKGSYFCGLSLYDGTDHHRAYWTWDGDQWDLASSENVTTTGQREVRNGWWRVWVHVGEEEGMVGGTTIDPYIYVAETNSPEGEGNYVWGAQLEFNKDTPTPPIFKGDEVSPTRMQRRQRPNDFWYNYKYRMDIGDTLGSGACSGGFVYDTEHTGMWFAADDQMDLERAWAIIDTTDVGVALGDLEISALHPDLYANIAKNQLEISGVDGVDDDGNGFVDDFYGWDFVNNDNTVYMNPQDDNWSWLATTKRYEYQHGTQMASLIGAVANNEGLSYPSPSQGTTGVCWSVPILPIKELSIGSPYDLNCDDCPNDVNRTYHALFAADYMTDFFYRTGTKIGVMSMSYLGQQAAAMRKYASIDILPVVGAGNTNTPILTGLFQNGDIDSVLCVGAVRSDGRTGNDSAALLGDKSTSYGDPVDVVGYAAGDAYWNSGPTYSDISAQRPFIWTLGMNTAPTAADAPLLWCNNFGDTPETEAIEYGVIPTPSFTSGATAQASGLAALIRGLYDVSAQQTKMMIERGAVTDIYDGRNIDQCNSGDCDSLLGTGRMNAYRSMTLWGKIEADTTLSGIVYVSGDLLLKPKTTFVTIASGTVFRIAPHDIYENEIDADYFQAQPQYEITGLTVTNPSPPEEAMVEIYLQGIVNILGPVTFESWAQYPGDEDWGGIWTQTGAIIIGGANITTSGTTLGDY